MVKRNEQVSSQGSGQPPSEAKDEASTAVKAAVVTKVTTSLYNRNRIAIPLKADNGEIYFLPPRTFTRIPSTVGSSRLRAGVSIADDPSAPRQFPTGSLQGTPPGVTLTRTRMGARVGVRASKSQV